MRHLNILCIAIVAVYTAACASQPKDQRTYALKGQVIGIDAGRKQALIKHGDIPGLMPAMTMSYKMKDEKLLSGVKEGDLIDATLVIVPDTAYITQLKKTGEAPIEKPPADAAAPAPSSAPPLLTTGESVP